MSKRQWAVMIAVGVLAAALRLGYPGVNAFAFDEARLSLLALQTARTGEIATVGMTSSAGVPNMPAAAWVFALPYALGSDPLVPTLFVGVLGVLAVLGVAYLAGRWGTLAALVAGGFLAAHPYAALYARSIWAQNLLVPLAALWLVAAYRAAVARPWWAVALASFLAGFALQVHFAGAALALASAYALLRWGWWRQPLAVLTGGLLAMLAALPFALTPGALEALLNTAGGTATLDLAAWADLVRLLAGLDWAFLLHGDAPLPLTRLTPTIVNIGLGALSLILLLLGGLLLFAPRLPGMDEVAPPPTPDPTPPAQTRPLIELALVLLLAAPLMFTRHSTPVFLHYLLTSLPAAALLLGWGCAAARPAWLRYPLAWVVGFVVLGWVGGMARGLPYAGEYHTPNGLPEPLRTLRPAAAAPPDDAPVLFFTHGDNPTVQGEPAIFRALWWERGETARIIDGRRVLVLPDTPATLMFTERAFQAWEEADQSGLLADVAQIPRREGIAPFELTAYTPTPPTGFTLLAEPVQFEHGAVLRGWRAYQVGPRTRVSTLWHAPGPLNAGVQQFHHLRTATTQTGDPVAISDVSVRGHLWRDGDTVIVMADFFDLDPTTSYTVQTGHYLLSSLERFSLANGGDVVTLGAMRPAAVPQR